MLYYIFDWLEQLIYLEQECLVILHSDSNGYHNSTVNSTIWGDKFIDLLKKKQITEIQRDKRIALLVLTNMCTNMEGYHY